MDTSSNRTTSAVRCGNMPKCNLNADSEDLGSYSGNATSTATVVCGVSTHDVPYVARSDCRSDKEGGNKAG